MIKQVFLINLFCGIFTLAANAADLKVADKNLQNCIDKIAQSKKWTRAEDFTSIKCHSKNIQSLEGIDKFRNVTMLSFHKNKIAEVDIAGFDLLEHLNLARNDLSTLTLTNLPALRDVYVFGNKLTRFELADLPELEQLKANSNELLQFTYKDVPSLEKIYLFDNQLETIDIYNLPSMKYMDVRQNPMPDELYEEMDVMKGVTILHDGNAEDWQ